MELHQSTAHELGDLLASKELSSAELTASVLARVADVEERVSSYITLTPELAMEQARAVDQARADGKELGPLAGIPMGIKDNMSTTGTQTTCASSILKGYKPVYDATVVSKLREAGGVFVGKTNLDEFAFGSSTENSAFGASKNPWDTGRVPGGSSGGSAACVAAGEAVIAVGSDTGGSIRQPASLCGVVGVKPTYGRVSRYGLVAFASSLDQIGPLARDVKDAAIMMNVICGHDEMDNTCLPNSVPNMTADLTGDIADMKIGIVKELTSEGLEPGVEEAFNNAVKVFEDAGAVCEVVSLPNVKYSLPVYYLIASSEASSNLSRFDAVRYGVRAEKYEDMLEMYTNSRGEGFGAETKRRVMLGTYALSAGYYDAYYGKALKVRTLIRRDFGAAFSDYDVLISPTSPCVAFKMGEKTQDPLQMYLSDVCTVPVNLAGLPAVSLPCGLSENMPVGLQVIAPALEESRMLKIADAFERRFEGIGVPTVAEGI